MMSFHRILHEIFLCLYSNKWEIFCLSFILIIVSRRWISCHGLNIVLDKVLKLHYIQLWLRLCTIMQYCLAYLYILSILWRQIFSVSKFHFLKIKFCWRQISLSSLDIYLILNFITQKNILVYSLFLLLFALVFMSFLLHFAEWM